MDRLYIMTVKSNPLCPMAPRQEKCIIRASPFSLFHKEYQSDFVVFWPPWNDVNVHVQDVDMNEAGHRERVSYARVLMFFQTGSN